MMEWKQSRPSIFWAEIAPPDHIVQIYEKDETFLNSLEDFTTAGFKEGNSVIVIATHQHILGLEDRLSKNNFNLDELHFNQQYIPLDVHEFLSIFMKDGEPDKDLFVKAIKKIIDVVRAKNNRPIRAYAEAAAVLWAQGKKDVTLELEQLWNDLCHDQALTLFCAYPKSDFTQDIVNSIEHICALHSKIVAELPESRQEIYYKRTETAIAEQK